MNNEILWVGCSFDSTESYESGDYLDQQHYAINSAAIQFNEFYANGQTRTEFPSGAILDEWRTPEGLAIEIYDAMDSRIGFGILVADIPAGRALIPKVKEWFLSLGLTLPVSVWAWCPAMAPSNIVRPAGVDRLISLDLA